MNNNTFEKDELINSVRAAIKTFLISNGGMDNGYSTWVEGDVTGDTSGGCLKWSTPVIDKLTGETVRKMGRELYKKIDNIVFNKYQFGGTIRFTKEHIEYGCCRTTIQLIDTYTCYLS